MKKIGARRALIPTPKALTKFNNLEELGLWGFTLFSLHVPRTISPEKFFPLLSIGRGIRKG